MKHREHVIRDRQLAVWAYFQREGYAGSNHVDRISVGVVVAGSARKRERRERWDAWSKRSESIDELAEVIGDGANLSDWCRKIDFPFTTVRRWITDDPIRTAIYVQARQLRGDRIFDSIEKLADAALPKDANGRTDLAAVAHRKLAIDTKKWIAARLNASYNESLSVNAKVDASITHQMLEPKKMSDEELESIVRRGLDFPPDGALTMEHLQQAITTARLDWMQAVSAFARDRGIEPQHLPRLQHDPAVKARQSDQSANGNDFSKLFTRPKP